MTELLKICDRQHCPCNACHWGPGMVLSWQVEKGPGDGGTGSLNCLAKRLAKPPLGLSLLVWGWRWGFCRGLPLWGQFCGEGISPTHVQTHACVGPGLPAVILTTGCAGHCSTLYTQVKEMKNSSKQNTVLPKNTLKDG